MSEIKFDKEAASTNKESLITPNNQIYNILKDINKNLDIINENWKGQRATETLSNVENIKNNNDLLLKRLEENISMLGGVINTYDLAENAGVVGSGFGSLASLGSSGNFSTLKTTNKLAPLTHKGEEYYSVNTKISPMEYLKIINKNKLWQRFALGSQCLIASQIYAMDMIAGTRRSHADFKSMEGAPAYNINKDVRSEDIEVVKKALFDGIQNGYPMVLQVSSISVIRHFVTVVGFKKGVTSSSQLSPSNILVIDNADGKIQTLSERNRRILKTSNGKYRVIGPTQKFLNSINA